MGWSRTTTLSEVVQVPGSSSVRAACAMEPFLSRSWEVCSGTHSRGLVTQERAAATAGSVLSSPVLLQPSLARKFAFPSYLTAFFVSSPSFARCPSWLEQLLPSYMPNCFPPHKCLKMWLFSAAFSSRATSAMPACVRQDSLHWPCQFGREGNHHFIIFPHKKTSIS